MHKVLLICTVSCALLLAAAALRSQSGQGAAGHARFEDAAARAGLTVRMVNGGEKVKKYIWESTGSGIAAIDYDRDGYPDLYIVNGTTLEGFPQGSEPTNHLYHNNRDGTFTDVTRRAGLEHSGWGHGVCAGDYDNDGFDDLFVTYYGQPNILYHNNGDGTFTDVTKAAGLYNPNPNWGSGCSFVDYNRDGKLDLFVAGYVEIQDEKKTPLPGSGTNCIFKGVPVYCGPRGLQPFGKSYLYRNRGDGTFTDVSAAAGIRKAAGCYGLGVLTADFGNRGWPDIYEACDSVASLFYQNNRDGTFTERGVEAGVAYTEDGLEQAGMGVSAGDYDGDGFLDIFKTNFDDDVPDLYHNEGDGHFTLRTFDAKLGSDLKKLRWGGGFFDFDNDGCPDLFIANGHVYPELEDQGHPESPYRQRNMLYHNLCNGTFEDVTDSAGPGLELRRSGRGVAFLDYDNDGALDIAINNQNDPPTLLHNLGVRTNHWVTIRTVGTRSNRDGIGARISVVAGGRREIDEVRSGGSYISQSDLRVHFGLGLASKVDQLEIRWPSGAVDKLENLPADRFLTVQEGNGIIESK
ncbi:MAG: FG-GAP-like repeat-containing protein [Terriglobia bacterium]